MSQTYASAWERKMEDGTGNSSKYTIVKNMPVPPRQGRKSKYIELNGILGEMHIGDMIEVRTETEKVNAAVRLREAGFGVACRKCPNGWRIWKLEPTWKRRTYKHGK